MEKRQTLTQITSIPKTFDKSEYFAINNLNMTLIVIFSFRNFQNSIIQSFMIKIICPYAN